MKPNPVMMNTRSPSADRPRRAMRRSAGRCHLRSISCHSSLAFVNHRNAQTSSAALVSFLWSLHQAWEDGAALVQEIRPEPTLQRRRHGLGTSVTQTRCSSGSRVCSTIFGAPLIRMYSRSTSWFVRNLRSARSLTGVGGYF